MKITRSSGKPGLTLAILLLTAVTARAQQQPAISEEDLAKTQRFREDMKRMIQVARDHVFPALVNIHVVTVNYWDGKEQKGRAVGSGTIISEKGYVVTNQHVTSQGQKFRCTLADRQEIPATLVGEDPLTDLAVLKLDLSKLKSPSTPVAVAKFGNSDDLEVGDHVMAMGSPLALSRSVTLGIVSNAERVFTGSTDDPEDMELEDGQRTGLFTRWIQHDALIHPGNSGGPLVNLKGEIVGINELGGNSMGFAIPSNLAETVTKTLIDKGQVDRSWIGVSFKPIEKTGLDKGVIVNSVVKDSPAAKGGIQAGDVILRVNGEAVTVRFAEEVPPLMKKLADIPIGAEMKISYQRGTSAAEATVTTGKLEKDKGEETALRAWGVVVEHITDKMARDRKFDDSKGALVTSVRSGSPSALAEPALSYGDVIQSIDHKPVDNLDGLVTIYKEVMKREPLPEYVLVEFDRSGKSNLTLVKTKPDDEEDPPREVPKAWIGIATQPVLEKLAKKLGDPEALGFRITRIYPKTVAAGSNLKVGDIITQLNGTKVIPRGMQDSGLFSRLVRKLTIEQTAELKLLRDSKLTTISIQLERTRPTPEEARKDHNKDFELSVRELTFFDRDENRWGDDVKGVLVTQVESAGWAGLGGIDADDLIQKINDYEIKGLKSYRKAMEEITKQQPQRVVFVVLRGVQTRFQYVEPEWKPVLHDSEDKTDKEKP
jgi:serine protease Do